MFDMLPTQLKLSSCHPLFASVTLAHSGVEGVDGDRGGALVNGGGALGDSGLGGGDDGFGEGAGGGGDGDGGLGSPAAKSSIGSHCGCTVLRGGEIRLVLILVRVGGRRQVYSIAWKGGTAW